MSIIFYRHDDVYMRTKVKFRFATKENLFTLFSIVDEAKLYVTFCTIWYQLYKKKNVKNTHEGVLFLVKLQAFSLQLS